MSKEIIKWLDDTESLLKVPSKKELIIDDIYVFPKLKRLNFGKQNFDELEKHISAQKLLTLSTGTPVKLLIVGDDSCGKTTLAKKFYQQLTTTAEMFPIYITGDDIKETSPEKILKIIQKRVNDQYIDTERDTVLNANPNKKMSPEIGTPLQNDIERKFVDIELLLRHYGAKE